METRTSTDGRRLRWSRRILLVEAVMLVAFVIAAGPTFGGEGSIDPASVAEPSGPTVADAGAAAGPEAAPEGDAPAGRGGAP